MVGKVETATAKKIEVTNLHRNRPVAFSVGGQTVRLAPLETRELDAAARASTELSRLIHAGAVRCREVRELAAGATVEKATKDPSDAGKTSGHAEKKPSIGKGS